MRIEGITLRGTRVVDATIITQNLAIWIDANNPSSYSGSGTTITDLSGNNYTQNLSNADAYTDLNGVKCWNVSSAYYIQADSVGPTLPTTGFTYIAWARMKSSSADYRTLFRTNPDDHPLLIETGNDNLGMWDNNNTPNWNPSDPAYDVANLADVWVQWAVSGDSSGQIFYINGQEVGTTTNTAAGNAHDKVGSNAAGQYFGYLANMFLYTSKLTKEQIQQNYQALRDRFENPPGLKIDQDAFNYTGSGSDWSGATLVNSPTYSDAFMGQFDFNGTNQYVNLGSAQQASRSTGFSLNTWVKFDDLTGWQTFVGQDTSQASSYGAFYFQKSTSVGTGDAGLPSNTTAIRILNTSGALITCPDTTTVTTGVWYNFTATVSSSELKLYKNGVLVNTVSNSDSMAPTTGDMLAGAGWWADGVVDYLNGQLAVVQYYNKVITDQEVSDLYDEFSYRYPAVANLQLQYLYADYSGTGTVIPDSSGNGYDGTMVNGLTQDGKSLVYNGTDDWIYTPNMYSTFNSTTHFTLEVWYNPTWTNPNEGGTVVSEASDINHSSWHYALVEHERAPFGGLAYDYAGIWNGAYVSLNPYATKTGWRQIVLSYDGTNGVSYTNAATPRTVAVSRWTPWTNGGVNAYLLTIGRGDTTNQSGSGQNYFKGSIGIVRLYNRALSSTEVLANYNSTKAVYNL
jgi:hypothetical protein